MQAPALPRLILASGSAYRSSLLSRLQLPFEAIAPEIDETPLPDETPPAAALRLAQAKAEAIASRTGAALIIGQNIGTATSSALAAIGASATAKRLALAYVLFLRQEVRA